MPPITSSQRVLVNQFMAVTGVPEKLAQKLLKSSSWKIDQATDSYFASNGTGPNDKGRENLEKVFEAYRENGDEPETVGVNGTMRYLTDLGVDLENASMLVPLEIIQAPALGEITKEGFVKGWQAIRADTLAKQKVHVASQISQLPTDNALFKRVYRHVFVCARDKGQKALPLENAITYWEILFAAPGQTLATSSTNWADLWIEFLNAKWTKSVNKDMWNQTLEFLQKAVEDETLSFWSEDGAWPGVIDDFVGFVKTKRGTGECMETD